MKNVLIIGGHGNMGRRYIEILSKMRCVKNISIYDQDDYITDLHYNRLDKVIESNDFIIITTPTDLHGLYLTRALDKNKKVLCEKPITKELDELRSILNHENIKNFRMVNNWEYAFKEAVSRNEQASSEDTIYNYHHSGNDGLGYDCIQLIYLAVGKLRLSNDSQSWYSYVNGFKIRKADVINGYNTMLINFLTNSIKEQSHERLIRAHEVARDITYAHRLKNNSDRNTTKAKQHKATTKSA